MTDRDTMGHAVVPAQIDASDESAAARAFGGATLAAALSVLKLNPPPEADHDLEAFAAWLADGLTVEIACPQMAGPSDPPEQNYYIRRHLLRLDPAGTITPESPPCGEITHQEYLIMAALGESGSLCHMAAAALPHRRIVPNPTRKTEAASWRDMAKGHAALKAPPLINRHLRAVHAAIAWAQPGVDLLTRPLEAYPTFLAAGVRPDTVAEWTRAGWDAKSAAHWQRRFIPLDVADLWRRAGDTSRKAIEAALAGSAPLGEVAAYRAAGIPESLARQWVSTGLHPVAAARWHHAGFSPDAALDGSNHSKHCAVRFDPEAWVAAGLPAMTLPETFAHLCHHDLDLASKVLATQRAARGRRASADSAVGALAFLSPSFAKSDLLAAFRTFLTANDLDVDLDEDPDAHQRFLADLIARRIPLLAEDPERWATGGGRAV